MPRPQFTVRALLVGTLLVHLTAAERITSANLIRSAKVDNLAGRQFRIPLTVKGAPARKASPRDRLKDTFDKWDAPKKRPSR